MAKHTKKRGKRDVTEIDITELTPYKIVGKECGRDKNGVFRCKCGKCRPLSEREKATRKVADYAYKLQRAVDKLIQLDRQKGE